jgi:hypothetical protein
MDPVPDPLLLRKSGSAENRTRASGSVAKNSDHWTTEAVDVVHSWTHATELLCSSCRCWCGVNV